MKTHHKQSQDLSYRLQEESTIYWELRNKLELSHAAVCGIMANIFVESNYCSRTLQSKYEERYGFDKEEYTRRVDNKTITEDMFVCDNAGYGLCQWTFRTRKRALYRFMDERGLSIGDLKGQLGYLIYELKKDFPIILQVMHGNMQGHLSLKNKELNNILIKDSEQGAYDAAYYFCGKFEEPGENDNGEKCEQRGEIARLFYKRYRRHFLKETSILSSWDEYAFLLREYLCEAAVESCTFSKIRDNINVIYAYCGYIFSKKENNLRYYPPGEKGHTDNHGEVEKTINANPVLSENLRLLLLYENRGYTGAFRRREYSGNENKTCMDRISADNTLQSKLRPVIAIDPGHQAPEYTLCKKEPAFPGADIYISGMDEGEKGNFLKTEEYDVNLKVGMLLKKCLEERGYGVYITRVSNEVSMTKMERAQRCKRSDALFCIRLHCGGDRSLNNRGAYVTYHKTDDMNEEEELFIRKLSETLLENYCERTGLLLRGVYSFDAAYPSWDRIPTINLEMGSILNKEDEMFLADGRNHKLMAEGLAEGIEQYLTKA